MKQANEVYLTDTRGVVMELEWHKRSWRVTVRKRSTLMYRSIETSHRRAYEAGERYLASRGVTLETSDPREEDDE